MLQVYVLKKLTELKQTFLLSFFAREVELGTTQQIKLVAGTGPG